MDNCKFKVGDLIHEKHHPDKRGIIIEVSAGPAEMVIVEWVGTNPNNYSEGPETLEERYLVLLSRKEKDE